MRRHRLHLSFNAILSELGHELPALAPSLGTTFGVALSRCGGVRIGGIMARPFQIEIENDS